MGRPIAVDPGGLQLSLAYRSPGRATAIRLAHAVWTVCSSSRSVCRRGPSRPSRAPHRTVPPEEPPADLPGDVPHPDLPARPSIECGRTEMQRQLGNAVPSLIAEILAREIRRQFFGLALSTPLRLLPSGARTSLRLSRSRRCRQNTERTSVSMRHIPAPARAASPCAGLPSARRFRRRNKNYDSGSRKTATDSLGWGSLRHLAGCPS